MSFSRRCFYRPFNIMCTAFLMTTIIQVYLDIRRTEILGTSKSQDDILANQIESGQVQNYGESAPQLSNFNLKTNIANVSIEKYLKSYTLKQEYACKQIKRPESNSIFKYKDVYQHFKLTPNGYNTTDVYLLSFYYDDRFLYTGAKYIRTFVTIKGIGPERQASVELIKKTSIWSGKVNQTPTTVMLWYDGFDNPVSTTCSTKPAFGITRAVSQTFFYEYIITCSLPEIDMLPTHASIMQDACVMPSNYVKIVYPRPPRELGTRDIGVCMASLYGSMNSTEIPYFVSWMEALNIYGVTEINLNNALMSIDTDLKRVIDYYVSIGRLIYTQYPIIHETWRDYEQDAATESTNKMHVGDCFFRNIKRYWHTLVIDLDELPVPLTQSTYAETLDVIAAKDERLADAHCHTIRSAFFYFDFPPGNPEYPPHLPLNRYTNRFRAEPVKFGHHDGLGLGKSFHNSRRVVAMGHHLCRASHNELGVQSLKQAFIEESDMLIHHYRKQCKYTDDCKNMTNVVRDAHIPQTIGRQLQQRVETVLAHVKYNYK